MSETQTKQGADGTSNGTLAVALLAAQAEMPAVEPDATNPHFKSKFVSLGNLIAKVRPVLNKHGLAFAQFPSADSEGKPTLVTILMHSSGERMEYAAPLLLPKNDPQGQGSAITYMRRYALAAALGISDQEDDDGNSGAGSDSDEKPARARATAKSNSNGNGRPITAPQKGKVNALLGEAGASQAHSDAIRSFVAGRCGESAFDRIPQKAATALIDRLGEDGQGANAIVDQIIADAEEGDAVAQKVYDRYLKDEG